MRTRYKIILIVGLRGLIKSLIASVKYSKPLKIILHPKVKTKITKNSRIEIDNRFLMGVKDSIANFQTQGKSMLRIEQNGELLIRNGSHGSTNIGPCSIVAVVGGKLEIGDSYISGNSRIICEERIKIGDNCAISWNTQMIDTDIHELSGSDKTEKIVIEDDVWIGHDVIVKKGVTIGQGSVIASGSIVLDDIPSNCLAAGSPAKIKKKNISWK